VEGLTLGPGLVLPVEAVTETFAILAKRGAGKTYTATVLVKEMVAAGLPVVIVDPVGVCGDCAAPPPAPPKGCR